LNAAKAQMSNRELKMTIAIIDILLKPFQHKNLFYFGSQYKLIEYSANQLHFDIMPHNRTRYRHYKERFELKQNSLDIKKRTIVILRENRNSVEGCGF
jgi:hypothetical protein